MKSKSIFKTVLLLAVLFLAMAGCSQPFFPDPFYIRVVSIEGVPETGTAGTPLTLTGKIRPAFASNVDIIWSVKDAGTTGADISRNILIAGADGIVVITARISNGRAAGKDYIQDFIIVIGLGNPGELLTLGGDITITPNSGVTIGTELTAVYSGTEIVSYQWKKDGIVVGTDSDKYTPTEAGNYTVTVSAVGYNPKTSAAVNVIAEYTILIDIFDNMPGDTITVSPNKGVAGVTVTLSCTIANTAHYNQLDFGGVTAVIALIEEAGSGTRTYTINAEDTSNGVITITAVFTHTDLKIDHIAFEDTAGHITKTYGDAPFTNAITDTHKGTGKITYHSSDTNVATVDNSGLVIIREAGSAVISAEKAADETYAHAQTTYTLTVNTKPVTITGLSVEDKVYDGTTTATVTGTAVINGLVLGDDVTVIAGTASFVDAAAGNNKTVTFSGWSLAGADAGNYTLSAQPAPVTANITNSSVEIVIDWTGIDEWQLIEQSAQATANVAKGFTVAGSYTTDHTYRWYLDGVLVGDSSNYVFKQPADVYQLVVVVTNSSGESRSGRCRITVNN